MQVQAVRKRLLTWYEDAKRDLPWRRSRDPYRVWISEIMLQQTRVAAAIPYYERFLERFPSVRELAVAPEQDLLAAWAGLGYYARARNLQRAAKKILDLGGFPHDFASIRELAGVGDYTAGAVASIAFNRKHPALDGNAIRVLSRLTAESGNIASAAVRKRLHDVAALLVHPRRPGEFNQAVMELGATVCLPKDPQCPVCPLRELCAARLQGREKELPLKIPRPNPMDVDKQVLVIQKSKRILLWQRTADSRRLAGFWELPEPADFPGAKIGPRVAVFRHTIVSTKYSVHVHKASAGRVPKGFFWLAAEKLNELPLSTTAKKALACLARCEAGLTE